MDRLEAMSILLLTVEKGSFTATARILNMQERARSGSDRLLSVVSRPATKDHEKPSPHEMGFFALPQRGNTIRSRSP